MSHTPPQTAWARTGLFALPVYALTIAVATAGAQPDPTRDPGGWARFVSSPAYLVEHVIANVAGSEAVRLRSDVERKRLHGLDALARTDSAPGAGLYTQEADRLTYGRLTALAGEALAAGYPVVVDAAFLKRAWRGMFRELARARGVPFVLVACSAPEETLRERVARREREGADASEAGLPVLERQLAKLGPLLADELDSAVIVDAQDAEEAMRVAAKSVAARIRS